ncbi:MAG: PAS domain S-box protein [Pseudomonadota bacterium]|nr:PAS domain S-box protein [Pseudomonadota bacterium]
MTERTRLPGGLSPYHSRSLLVLLWSVAALSLAAVLVVWFTAESATGSGLKTFVPWVLLSVFSTCIALFGQFSPRLRRHSFARFQMLADESLDGVLVVDADGLIISANDNAYRILGYEPGALLEHAILDILDPSDPRTEPARQARREDRCFYGHLYLRKADHSRLPATMRCTVHEDDGKELVTTILFRDDSARVELKNHQNLLMSSIDRLSDVILVISPKAWGDEGPIVTFANRSFECVTGWKGEDSVGRGLRELFGAENSRDAVEHIIDAMAGGQYCFERLEGENPRGQSYCLELKVQPVTRGDGQIRNYVAIGRDVSEQRKAVQRLRESEQRFRAIFDQNPDPIFITDLEGCVISCNSAAAALAGKTPEELVGNSFELAVAEDKRELAWEIIDRIVKERQPVRYKTRSIDLNGRGRDIEATVVPIVAGGKIVGLSALLKDISEREQTLSQLSQSEQRFRAIFDRNPAALFVSDLQGRIISSNQAASRLVGLPPEGMDGLTFRDMVTDEDIDNCFEGIRRAMGGETYLLSATGRRANGELRDVDVTIVPIIVEGVVSGLAVLIEDVTERNQAETRLKQSERHYRAIFDQNPAAIFVTDLQGNITSCNHAAAAMAGVEPGAVENITFPDLVHSEGHSSAFEAFVAACKGETRRLVTRGLTSTGDVLDVDVTIVPIVVEAQVIGLAALVVDITETMQAQAKLVESEQYYRAVFDQNPFPVFVTNTEGRIVSCNAAAGALLASSPTELAGATINELVESTDKDATWNAFRAALDGKMQHLVTQGVRRDGVHRDIECTLVPIVVDGESRGVTCIADDVTELRKAEEGLRLSAKALESVAEASAITDLSIRIVSVNKAFADITGFSGPEVKDKTPFDLMTDSNDPDLVSTIATAIAQAGHWQGEMWLARKDGEEYPVLMTISAVYDESGAVTHYATVFTDISQYKRYEERLEFMAHHDFLTRLPNRALFQERLENAIARAARHESMVSVLFIDLDQFKSINDSLGHGIGDDLLVKVSERLGGLVRGTDTVARLGGDEFAVLLEDLKDDQDLIRVADKIIAAFGSPFELEGYELFTSASMGIVCYPSDGEDAETLLKKADAAMYQAKDYGRNNYRFFSPEINAKAHEYLVLANNLRYALERDEFRLYYQPLIDLSTGEVRGVEALIRWQHPEFGLVSPVTFIPVAEATGLINQIGTWVLRTACVQGKKWQDAGFAPIRIAVNLSARQFRDAALVDTLNQILEETGLDGRWVELEVTESMMMENPSRVKDIMYALKKNHVSIAIDDFGTGYSSLSYLKEFPFDFIKIDRSFVMGIPGNKSDTSITETIIAMAKSLHIAVIAEGIETPDQEEYLLKQGCDEGQGYLFSKPVPADQLELLLSKWPHPEQSRLK